MGWTFVGRLLTCAGLLGAAAVHPARADNVADFYRHKIVRMIIGTEVGGPYDTYGRLLGRHLGDHIPGNPTVTIENMAGATSVIAANYLADAAPRDGTVLVAIDNVLPLLDLLGNAKLRFDPAKLNWIGNMVREVYTLYVRADVPIKTIDDARQRVVTIGATNPTGQNFMLPRIVDKIAGTKFKLITGYPGAAGVQNAMMRNEVQGFAGDSWSNGCGAGLSFDWYRNGTVRVLLAFTDKRPSGLAGVPLLMDLAKDEPSKELARLFLSPGQIGKPIVVAPGVPAERVAALRRAFDETVADPSFVADAERLKLNIDPVSGEQLEALAARLSATPSTVVQDARDALKNP
jgi:tripartite-type tricarboxylate transporter receptor subunit TctC